MIQHNFAPGAMEILLGMQPDEIEAASARLIGLHATQLPEYIAAPWDDYDLIFQADGNATLLIRLWQDMVPPFRHAVVRMVLEFDAGHVSVVSDISRKSFGA